MAETTRDGGTAQQISDTFTGTTGAEKLKDSATGRGIEARTIPAFVAGEELAELGDADPRIVVLTVCFAPDANQLRAILRRSLDRPGAMYIRLGRGRDPEVYPEVPDLEIGRAVRLRDGHDLTLIATGSEVPACLDAAESLGADG